MRWENPPERRGLVFNAEVVAELRANPGRWALIRERRCRGGDTRVKHPADIEIKWHEVDGINRLYARARVPS